MVEEGQTGSDTGHAEAGVGAGDSHAGICEELDWEADTLPAYGALGEVSPGSADQDELSKVEDRMDREVEVTEWARAEVYYWSTMLPFCGRRTLLPDPDYQLPPWALTADTDAAGGTRKSRGYGAGAVLVVLPSLGGGNQQWGCPQ